VEKWPGTSTMDRDQSNTQQRERLVAGLQPLYVGLQLSVKLDKLLVQQDQKTATYCNRYNFVIIHAQFNN